MDTPDTPFLGSQSQEGPRPCSRLSPTTRRRSRRRRTTPTTRSTDGTTSGGTPSRRAVSSGTSSGNGSLTRTAASRACSTPSQTSQSHRSRGVLIALPSLHTRMPTRVLHAKLHVHRLMAVHELVSSLVGTSLWAMRVLLPSCIWPYTQTSCARPHLLVHHRDLVLQLLRHLLG